MSDSESSKHVSTYAVLALISIFGILALQFIDIATYNDEKWNCQITLRPKLICNFDGENWETDLNCNDLPSTICNSIKNARWFLVACMICMIGNIYFHEQDEKIEKKKRIIFQIIIALLTWFFGFFPFIMIVTHVDDGYKLKVIPLILEFIITCSNTVTLILNLIGYERLREKKVQDTASLLDD